MIIISIVYSIFRIIGVWNLKFTYYVLKVNTFRSENFEIFVYPPDTSGDKGDGGTGADDDIPNYTAPAL